LKLNKIYYRNLLKSLVIIVVGLVILMKEALPIGAVSDNYFVLVMGILSGFFGSLGIIGLLMRLDKLKFRRKFFYSFFGVANFCIGGLSIFYAIRHKTAGPLALAVYIFSFVVGLVIIADIFFGKRPPKKYETEVLIN
jgi:drug/metabolite transporter (DMT)-like permease